MGECNKNEMPKEYIMIKNTMNLGSDRIVKNLVVKHASDKESNAQIDLLSTVTQC